MRHPQRALFDRPGRIRHSLAEHQVLLKAILEGDEDAAARAMSTHISSGGNVYADAIASLPATAHGLEPVPAPQPAVELSPGPQRVARRRPTPRS